MDKMDANKENDNIIELKAASEALREKKAQKGKKPVTEPVLLQMIMAAKEIYALFSACTKSPYVVCDPETFDDEIFLCFSEAEAQAEGKTLLKEKIPVTIVKIDEKRKLLFFSSLFSMGINALVFTVNGEKHRLQLTSLVTRREPEGQEGKSRVENPELMLTALYYAQEVRRRQVSDDEPQIQEMQEEMLAHFKKGRYIFAVDKETKNTPLLKLNEKLFHPIFTDILEFQKFNREQKFVPVVVPADRLPKQVAQNAEGLVINPFGLNLVMNIGIGQPPQDAAKGQE